MITPNNSANIPILSRGMIAVLIAQFLSALADNALLFAAIAMLKFYSAPSWQTPLLQASFVIGFILLAPFVGPFADSWPKGRVMMISNGIKLVGAAAMLIGVHPLAAYGLVGIGAAAYSPAKYGILSEIVSADSLVKANSMMEGSTIVAILLGAVLGGKLADSSVPVALYVVCFCYLLASGANVLIPKLPAAHTLARYSPTALIRDFGEALAGLFRDVDARFSLIGTSIFWGSGSTLRLLLVAWVPVALGIADLSLPANLSGAVAIGIAVGATVAANMVRLGTVNRVLPAGMLIGFLIMVFSHATNLYASVVLLILVGACGGFYVVPLNALLQDRGHASVGAGHAVAVQNFVENFVMLALVLLYTALEKNGVPTVLSATIFGGVVLLAISLLSYLRLRRTTQI